MLKVERLEVVAARVSPPPEQAALRALRGEWVFVVAHGAYGLRGYGEATHSGDDEACARLIRGEWVGRLEDEVIPAEPEALGAWLGRWSPATNDRVACTAYSAVEVALCDLAARTAEVPLWQWLRSGSDRYAGVTIAEGPTPGVALYATLNRGIFDRSPEGFAAAARAAVAEGFSRLKCAPFDGVERSGAEGSARRAAIELGVERVAAVRSAVGPEVELMVDCHGRFGEAEAIDAAGRLVAHGLRWLEEPVAFEPDPGPLVRVRRAVRDLGLEIAAGELMFGADGFAPLLERGAVDVVMPDVKHCGGVLAAGRIAGEAARHGVRVTPHNPSGPVSTLASAHLCAAIGALLLEYAWGEVHWRATLLRPKETIRGGCLLIPDGPGLAVEVDEDVLREHSFSV